MKLRIVATALTAVLLCTAAAAQTMRISISVAQNSHQGVGIDTFAKEVEARTKGRIKVQPFYSGSLGGERESIEAVQLGTQELTFTSTGPVPNFVPEARILDVPFLCSTAQSAAKCSRNSKRRALRRWRGAKTGFAI
jgi:TRAP-type transport system periplasmic protein